MTFTVDELEALVLGARLVQAWADPEMGIAVRGAMSKIESVLPEPLQAAMLRTALFGPPARVEQEAHSQLPRMRRAISSDRWLDVQYVDAKGTPTERTVVPLALYFWGPNWLLATYCWLRNAYRTFRVDRVATSVDCVPDLERLSSVVPPISLEQYILAMESENRMKCPPASAQAPLNGSGPP